MEDLPVMSSNPNDSRSIILKILSKKWPLTAKQVYYEARRHNHNLTYQAIHKTMKQLEAQKVICREKEGYRIDKQWIASLFAFTDDLRKSQMHDVNTSLLDMAENSTRTIAFDAIVVEPYYWLLSEIGKIVASRKKKSSAYLEMDCVWPITVITEKEHAELSKLSSFLDIYIACQTYTRIDKYLLAFWEKYLGAKWKAPRPVAKKGELIIFYDYIVEKYEEPLLRKDWKQVWAKSNKLNPPDLRIVYDFVFNRKRKVKFVITRNKILADSLLSEKLSVFG